MTGKTVVVTGASGGVGRATAVEFARKGYDVALFARGETGLAAAAAQVREAGARALPLSVDVADFEQLAGAADQVERELGEIDVWVNVAFSSVFAPFMEIAPEEFRRTTEVAYLGFVHGTRVALDRMLPRDRGVVVQVGSALAYRGIPLQTAYCGAKHAIQGFNEALRCELLHSGTAVRTTMVQLPAVNTPQFDWVLSRLPRHPQPVPPIYQPEVIARAILHAARHPQRREYYVGSSTVATILGDKLAAGFLDHYLARTGFDSQQTSQPVSPGRPANLWEPADGADGKDFGAHGSFDAQAKSRSWQALFNRTPWAVSTLANAAAAAWAGGVMVAKDRAAFWHSAEDMVREALQTRTVPTAGEKARP